MTYLSEEELEGWVQGETELQRNSILKRLERIQFLPSQKRLIQAYNDPAISTVIFTGPNQTGKSLVMTANLIATVQGYEPWSGKQRRFQPPVHVAMLLDDYDNAANKWFNQNLSLFYPIHPESGYIHVKRTQTGAPREIHFLKSLSGRRNGSVLHIYTQDQESRRCAGPTFNEFYVDEPQPKAHFIEIARGLQAGRGKTVMTMTPISEPWIFDELYNQAGNMGGSRPEVYAITAFPDENLKSRGGHLDDRGVEEFRATLSEEEKEARVYGRWMHLLGRVYKSFEERVHCLDSCPETDFLNGTHGIAVDPHDRIPFAIGRFVITPAEDIVFFDEWPREPFEEIKSSTFTLDGYADLFQTFSPPPFWRIMDPNFGRRSTMQAHRRGLTLAEEFGLRGMPFITDIVDDLAAGHKAVQARLAYDTTRPLSPLNQPSLYVTRNCRNIITALRNYVWDDHRGKIGENKEPKAVPKEKYKHYCDALRYTCMARISFVSRRDIDRLRTQRGSLRPSWEGGRMPRQVALHGGEPRPLYAGTQEEKWPSLPQKF